MTLGNFNYNNGKPFSQNDSDLNNYIQTLKN